MSSGSFDNKAAASEAVAVGTAAPAPPAAPPLPPPPQPSQSLASLLAAAERASEPAVFRGALTDWPPARRWGGGARGLEYLKAAAGGATVRAMRSKGPFFYGELGAHAPVELPLGAVADAALAALLGSEHGGDGGIGDAEFLYVAQQPLPKCDGGSSDEAGLAALARDAAPPAALLGARDLASANLWLSPRAGRSSLHYDPHHGLLAVVAGAKTVTLLRPDAAIGLSPRSPLGESPNHSAAPLEASRDGTDNGAAARLYAEASAGALRVELAPGDALFIPEGWWHQVDSADATIAVNFWWESAASAALRAAPHLHGYFLRLLQASVLSQATEQLLAGVAPLRPKSSGRVSGSGGGGCKEEGEKGRPAKRARAEEEEAWAADALERAVLGAAEVSTDDEAGGGAAAAAEAGGGAAAADAPAGCEWPCEAPGWRAAFARSQQRLVHTAVDLTLQKQQQQHGSSTAATAAAEQNDPLGLRHPVTRALRALSPLPLAGAVHRLATRAPAAMRALLLGGGGGGGDQNHPRLPPAAARLLTDGLEEAERLLARGDNGDGGGSGGSGGTGTPALDMQAVYAAMYGPRVLSGGDGSGGGDDEADAALRNLLEARQALAAAVARAVLPDPTIDAPG